MSWCESVWFHPCLDILSSSFTYISVSFFQLGKFSAIVFSNTFLIPISLLFLEPLLCIDCHALHYPIDLACCFHFFFHLSVYCSDCVISLFCLPDHLFIFLHHLVCYSLLSGWFLSWQLSCLILTHSSLLFLVPCYSDLLLYQ